MIPKLTRLALLIGAILAWPAQSVILDEEPPKAVVAPRPKKHQKSAIEIENERMKKELAAMKQQQKAANEEIVQVVEPPSKPTLSIGSTGPSGGIIFYLDSSGEYGLEVKRTDEPENNWNTAIKTNYGSGWRMPTKNELDQLYLQSTVVGGFANINYWSSTDKDSNTAWSQSFANGARTTPIKNAKLPVRAVRAF